MSREHGTRHSLAMEQLHLLPGFRFHPTDEELIIHYLIKKAESKPFPVPIISEVELYKFTPWELPEKALFGEKEWYFFTPRDRKYPNGARPNRAASTGYWKATGTDKPIFNGGNRIGIKKALVYYDAKPPLGVKTNWIMHEYRLADGSSTYRAPKEASLRLDDWVLCRIYEKTSGAYKAMASNSTAEPESYEPVQAPVMSEPACWEEILAALPEIDSSTTTLTTPLCTPQSLDDFLNSPAVDVKPTKSDVFQPQQQYLNDSPGFGDSSKSSCIFDDSWYNNFAVQYASPVLPENLILQQVQTTRKRTRFNIEEDDDERSTCTSPIPSLRLRRPLPARTLTL